MKIAMIGHKRVPSREGGIEVVVAELSTRMVALGHRVDCYNRWEPSVQKKMPRVSKFEGVRLLRVRTFKRSALNAVWYSFFATLRALGKRYSVIHFHAEGPAAMLPMARLLGIPTVTTIHGLDWQRAKWGGFATRFLLFGEKMAAKYSDRLIVLTKDHQDYFLQKYHRETVLIGNGITPKPHKAAREITERWGLEKDDYILFLARIVPEKGLHYLIEAYGQVKTDKRLVIAGPIDLSNAYIRKICERAALDKRILMTDYVTGNTLDELMSNCKLFVLPSDVEGMSLSLLEALGYGKMCLLSDIIQNRETARTYAYYFAHGDVEFLQYQLRKLVSLSEDPETVEKRIAYVEERFNWDQVTRATLETYADAINERHAPSRSEKARNVTTQA